MPQLTVTMEEWKRAFRFSLANAMAFLAFSLVLYFWEPDSLLILLSVPALFFLGAIVSFVLFVRNGGAFAAIAWFMLGSGVYFGLGVFVGGLAPEPGTVHYTFASVLYADLIRINLLNSSSVILVLVAAIPFAYAPRILKRIHTLGYQEMIRLLVKIFPLMTILAIAALGLQFLFFPVAANLLVRTFVSSFYMIVLLCCLALGMLRTRLEVHWRALGVSVFLSAFCFSLLSMSKLAAMSTLLAVVVGSWVHRRSIFSVTAGLLLIGALYVWIGGITNEGRLHRDYDAAENSALTRFQILIDTALDDSGEGGAVAGDTARGIVVPRTIGRFSVVAIQGYLMEAYDQQTPGTSLDDFWVAAIPRVFWPDKPIVTRFGAELHMEFWATPEASSALAPTYNGEAYWNYGPVGVVIVSLLLGLQIGWLTYRWHITNRGLDPAFFLIAFPASLWAMFVENWIAASYIGGFLTIVVIWLCARLFFLKVSGGAQLRSPLG